MALLDMNIYTEENAPAVMISIVLFLLHTILGLLDANTYVQEIIEEDEAISGIKMFYSYIYGYIMFFIKAGVSMFTLWVLISVIMVGFVLAFSLLKPAGGNFGDALFEKFINSLKNNAVYVLGIFMIKRALSILVILGPVTFLLILICFTAFLYKKNKIPKTYPDKEYITKTYHNHLMMLMSFIIVFSIFAIAALYARDFVAFNPHLMP
jgi:hypothetical protein